MTTNIENPKTVEVKKDSVLFRGLAEGANIVEIVEDTTLSVVREVPNVPNVRVVELPLVPCEDDMMGTTATSIEVFFYLPEKVV